MARYNSQIKGRVRSESTSFLTRKGIGIDIRSKLLSQLGTPRLIEKGGWFLHSSCSPSEGSESGYFIYIFLIVDDGSLRC